MTRPGHPTVLERLQIGGLKPAILAEWKDRHRKRTACACRSCTEEAKPEPEPGQLGAFDEDGER